MAVRVTIPQQQRQGVYQSPSYRVLDGTQKLLLRLQIPAADYENPANTVTLRFYWLDPATQTWRQIGSALWSGGRYVDEDGVVDPDVIMEVGVSAYIAQEIRAEIEVPNRMRIGGTVETIP